MIGLIVILAVMSAACVSHGNGFPDYASPEDNIVALDIAEASDNTADFNPEGPSIVLKGEGYETTYAFAAGSGIVGASWERTLDQLSANLTTRLVPGDGTADFFPVLQQQSDSGELHITVFLDQDWRDRAGDGLFINSAEFGPDFRAESQVRRTCRPEGLAGGWPQERSTPVDFSQAVNGVYFQRLVFTPEKNPPEWKGSPIIEITNMGSSLMENRSDFNNLTGQPQDWSIAFAGQFDCP